MDLRRRHEGAAAGEEHVATQSVEVAGGGRSQSLQVAGGGESSQSVPVMAGGEAVQGPPAAVAVAEKTDQMLDELLEGLNKDDPPAASDAAVKSQCDSLASPHSLSGIDQPPPLLRRKPHCSARPEVLNLVPVGGAGHLPPLPNGSPRGLQPLGGRCDGGEPERHGGEGQRDGRALQGPAAEVQPAERLGLHDGGRDQHGMRTPEVPTRPVEVNPFWSDGAREARGSGSQQVRPGGGQGTPTHAEQRLAAHDGLSHQDLLEIEAMKMQALREVHEKLKNEMARRKGAAVSGFGNATWSACAAFLRFAHGTISRGSTADAHDGDVWDSWSFSTYGGFWGSLGTKA